MRCRHGDPPRRLRTLATRQSAAQALLHSWTILRNVGTHRMSLTFREAVAEVALGLVSSDQLPEVATSGLLEGYLSPALAAVAAQFGELCDPVEIDRLWTAAVQELDMTWDDPRLAGRVVVRAYARLVAEGELPAPLGASKIAGVHGVVARPGCDRHAPGDCLGAADVVALFTAAGRRGSLYGNERARLDAAIVDACQRLASLPTP